MDSFATDPADRVESIPSRRERARPLWHYVAGLAISVALANLMLGEKGLVETLRVDREHRRLTSTLATIRQQNQRLKERIARHDDPAVIEELARRNLGMIKPGEVVVVVKDGSSPAPAPAPRSPAPPQGSASSPSPVGPR